MKKFNPYTSVILATVLLTIAVILAELSPDFKRLLRTTFQHHWLAKIVIVALAFAIGGFLYKKPKIGNHKTSDLAYCTVVASIVIISVFYVVHYFI